MEGPADPTISQGEGETRNEGQPKPPGGKALLRMLYHLEQRGYTAIADATINAAIPEQSRPEFDLRRARFSAVPKSETAKPTVRREKKGSAEESTAAVAQQHLDAAPGPPMGRPTPSGPQWRQLGPYTIPNGQTYGSSRVNVSGRVAAIAVDPSNAAHVLCGAANGGVWESFDRGASWWPRTDYAATLTVGALAFDPTAPATVYCGTGEGNWWSWLGVGLLKSTNGGTTWTTLCTAPFVGAGFYDLKIHPSNHLHLLAATNRGLYTSADGGVTWTQRRAQVTWSISISPTGGAAAEILAGCADGIFRSTDGGATWAAAALPGGPAGFDRVAVSIAHSNPAVAYVWGARGATVFFYRRAGGAWAAQPIPPGAGTGQAWYDWYLSAAPDVDTQVYCAGIESSRGDLAGGVWTWRTISNKGAVGDSIHPDQHAIAFEPGNPNMIYVGCDGGLFRSPDRGITWVSCNNGLVITEFEYLAQNFGSSRWVIGGTQDNGTERWTGSAVFTHVADGDGGACAVNRSDPNTVFHTYYDMSPERSTTGGDFGSWAYLPPPVPAGEGSLFYPPLRASASGGNTVAIGGGALYVSRDNMSTWVRVAFPAAATASAIYIPDANTVYVGTTDGRIYKTTWGGAAWNALSAVASPRAGAYISEIVVDPNNASRIWVTSTSTGGGRVFLSIDAGAHWADRTAGLPNLPITSIQVDPSNGNRIWVGADLGVHQSFDAGATWADFSASLPNAFVGDLVFHPWARVLRAGLRNRGIWEIPVDGWLVNPICGLQWNGTLNPNETKSWFSWGWPATWHMIWTVMPVTPKPGAAEITWTVQVERSGPEFATYWIKVQNLTNVTVNFEGRYCILSRY